MANLTHPLFSFDQDKGVLRLEAKIESMLNQQ